MGTSQKPSFSFARGVIFVIALAIFLYAGVQLFLIGKDYIDSRQSYNHVKDAVNVTQQKETPPEERTIDFKKLQSINWEAVGWIYVPAVGIDYPLMYTTNNDKYLRTTIEGTQQIAGSIFIDYRNHGDLTDQSTYIYGHHMKDKSMFSKLLNFQDKAVFDKNSFVYIYRPEATYEYKIFSVHGANARSSDYTLDFFNPGDFDRYVQTMVQKSAYPTGVSVAANDKIITLSTCTTTDLENDDRYVVQAKLVRVLPIHSTEKAGHSNES